MSPAHHAKYNKDEINFIKVTDIFKYIKKYANKKYTVYSIKSWQRSQLSKQLLKQSFQKWSNFLKVANALQLSMEKVFFARLTWYTIRHPWSSDFTGMRFFISSCQCVFWLIPSFACLWMLPIFWGSHKLFKFVCFVVICIVLIWSYVSLTCTFWKL